MRFATPFSSSLTFNQPAMRRSTPIPLCLVLALLLPSGFCLNAAPKKDSEKKEASTLPSPQPTPTKAPESEGRSLSDISASAVNSVVNFPKKLLSPLLPFTGKKKDPIVVVLSGIPKSLEAGKASRLNFTTEILNQGKKPVSLDFDSNVRVLATVESPSGEKVSTTEYVADSNPDPTSLTVNPTEKLRYDLSLSLDKPLRGTLYNIKVRIAAENISLEAKSSVLVR